MTSVIYLDAFLLASPDVTTDIKSFSSYIENIICWTELKNVNWIKIYISQNASESLIKANAYPPYDDLKKIISRLGIKHIQPKDVFELITSFLTKSNIIEEELGIEEFLYEDFNILPSPVINNRPEPLQEHFRLISILISLHQQFITNINNQIFITSNDTQHTGITEVKANITVLIKKFNTIIPEDVKEPISIFSKYYLCNCLHTLHLYIDPCNIWANFGNEFALRKALELYVYQSKPRQSPYQNPIENYPFKIGKHFIESCKKFDFFNNITKIKMLLRACSEVITNTNNNATHWLRSSIGGNSPQLKRGNESAWRRDIDHEYHLHYWQTTNGPELVIVVQHNDYSIPI